MIIIIFSFEFVFVFKWTDGIHIMGFCLKASQMILSTMSGSYFICSAITHLCEKIISGVL